MSRLRNCLITALFLLQVSPIPASGASVKPLEVFSEKILIREIEYLASEHSISAALLKRAVERGGREMDIQSKEKSQGSLKLLTSASEALAASEKSSAALSGYISSNSSRLKAEGHARFLPLAKLNDAIEAPYHRSLEKFLSTAAVFLRYCSDNFDLISSGSTDEVKRYEELYSAYIKEMDTFNDRSVKRSQLLAEWGSEYPGLWELMPR